MLLLSALLLAPAVALADEPVIKTYGKDDFGKGEYTSALVNKDRAGISFELLLMKNKGKRSFWADDAELWLDGVKICRLSDLGIPTVEKTDGKFKDEALRDKLRGLTPEQGVLKSYTYNDFIAAATYDPRYVTIDHKMWVRIGLVLGYNVEGQDHRVEIRGNWVNSGKNPTKKVLGFNTTAFSTGDLPDNAGTATRQNGKVVWKFTGLKNIAGWRYAFSLPKSSSHTGHFKDKDVDSHAYWDAAEGATEYSNSFSCNNYEPVTVYPRIIIWRTRMVDCFQNGIRRTLTFRKDYSALTLNGYPRAANLRVRPTDSYKKYVKLDWDCEIKDPRHVDTNGRWYVFRRERAGQYIGSYEKIAEVAYTKNSSFSCQDKDADKRYYDESLKQDTLYEYAVCFAPNDWKVNEPDDAQGLGTSAIFRLERTFNFSTFTVTGRSQEVRIEWGIASIGDASGSNAYTLAIQRMNNATEIWETIKEERITSPRTISGSYTDKAGLVPYEVYKYRLAINVQGRDFESGVRYGSLTDGTSVKQFTATRGIHPTSVKLQWSVSQVGNETTYFQLRRRPLGSTNDDEWTDIYSTHGTASLYSHEDNVNPGSYYEYHLRLWVQRGDSIKGVRDYTTDGFGLATGVLSGRVFYDSGTAVEGVKVSLTPSEANGETISQFRSLRIDSVPAAGIRYTAPRGTLQKLMGGEYTVQMYLSPDADGMQGDTLYTVFETQGGLRLDLKADTASSAYTLLADGHPTALRLPANRWSHLSVAVNANMMRLYLNGVDSVQTDTLAATGKTAPTTADTLFVLGNAVGRPDSHFVGYVDEFRLFSKALAETEISQNYGHSLAGNESGLAIYWPMDEDITAQRLVYDYSKSNEASNARIGFLDVPATSSRYVPDGNQLSLSAYTDKDGNFLVRGIPFSGEGTNYIATPTLGIHKFSPASVSCYVSLNSLVFSGQNFNDVSSFPVSGRVRYADTTIPVEGVSICVDGLPVSRNGKLITTDENGDYELDVPIGDHFISVQMSGHTFADGGSYPAQAQETGLRHTFEEGVAGLDFFDETTVIVAGRVAGGLTEEAKPLGVDDGVANIGKAVIALDFKDDPAREEYIHAKRVKVGNAFYYEQDSSRRDFETEQGLSVAYVPEGANHIVIETDSVTGEFAVKLPPLRYTTSSVRIPSNGKITFDNQSIDATNATQTFTDSLVTDSTAGKYFNYQAAARFTYRSPIVLDITESADGAFGIDSVQVVDINGNKTRIAAYTVNADKTVSYTFGHPLYEQDVEYTYNIDAYELYVNKDGEQEVEYRDPMADLDVTLRNEYASTTSLTLDSGAIYKLVDETFTLDTVGHATYNFMAGLPNIHAPYTRSLHASYELGGQLTDWGRTIDAVVLGGLTNGNDFVTAGPDQVLFILRDPPGSQSKTVYEKGTSFTKSFNTTQKAGSKNGALYSHKAGLHQKFLIGTILGGVVDESEASTTTSGGVELNLAYGHNDTKTTTTTLTEQISTSSSPNFVGALGDVFVGMSTNTIIGTSRVVHVKKDEATGNYFLTMEEMLTTGERFHTAFNYTAYQIEKKVIPDIISMRNSVLKHVGSVDSVSQPPAGSQPLYITTLAPNDPNYGTSNDDSTVWKDKAVGYYDVVNGRCTGPSYTIVLPTDYNQLIFQDTIKYFNEQVSMWRQQLYNNEMAKVTAISQSETYLDKNYSFDSGATVAVSHTKRNHHDASHSFVKETTFIIGNESKVKVDAGGVMENVIKVTDNTYFSDVETWGSAVDSTRTISYTLQESGLGEAISVDVFDAPDGFGPIFYTRGGTTSNPYEDEVVTKYYKPGTVISEKTVQVEKPEIVILDPTVVGVPAGGTATFRVKLVNNSEAQKPVTYGLSVVGKNPDGAQINMDGRLVNNGISILLPFGETVKTFTLKQTNTDVMDYRGITLRLFSPSQPNDLGTFPGIYSDDSVTVQFQPACSDIRLEADRTVYNAEDRDMNTPLTLYMSDYDYSMASLKGVRLQYKAADAANFITLKEYVKDTAAVKGGNVELLPALTNGRKLAYNLDMGDRSFSDQNYVFRAVTVCDIGGVEVNNESAEIVVARDLSRPQLITTPSPATGILSPGDDISLTFNEDIAASSLTADGNFFVSGQLNGRRVAHETALALNSGARAKTSATIDLNMQSFSADMWLNYSADGRLFYHGVPAYGLAADIDDGRLVLTFDTVRVSSQERLPMDKWLYLHVSYDNTGTTPLVSAAYAQDATSVTLIDQQEVPEYCGNGPLTLGGGNLVGKMQELALWSTPRSMATAQATMYTTKNVFTDALIGYWPFDEGHGPTAEDKARARSLTLPAENAWWTNGANYAAVIDGNTALKANMASANTISSDSYLLEGWMCADKDQTGEAVLFNVSDSLLAVGLDSVGRLALVANGMRGTAHTADLRDGSWHHVALNVLKGTKGMATLYLDGNAVRQLSAEEVPALQGDALIIGAHRSYATGIERYDRFFKGAVDEVRLWKGRRTAEVIREMMYTRIDTLSEGLVAYYPMEATSLDGNNQVVTTGSGRDATGKAAIPLEAVSGEAGITGAITFSQASVPPLKPRRELENVMFSFVASERTVRINLDELPARLEGCNVSVTVKNVRDLHGNRMEPVTWSFYVNQSSLKWDETAININKPAANTYKRTVTFRNISGQAEKYNIIGLPSWLSVDHASGTLQPLGEEKLTLTVDPGLAIGAYESTIWLTGSQNIELPLRLTVRVEGERPNWKAEEGEYTMNVIGQLSIDGILSSDTADVVGAFIGDRCVGVTSPMYLDSYDAYMLLFNISAHGHDKSQTITYRAYDASTGRTYPVVAASQKAACKFTPDTWAGSFSRPVVFLPENKMAQEISRESEGWSWISLYVKPDNSSPEAIFEDVQGAVIKINDYLHSSQYANGKWQGNLIGLDYHGMYKVNCVDAFKVSVEGLPINPDSVAVTLNSGWSWIGYPVADVNTLDAAFADAAPMEGDIVKSRTLFAMFTDGRWVGNLKAMTPGEGYIYYSHSAEEKVFHYPNVVRQSSIKGMAKAAAVNDNSLTIDLPGYENNMTMVAVVKDGDVDVPNSTVEVYADGTLRGRSKADAAGLHFLTIGGGERQEQLTFVVTSPYGTRTLSGKMTYRADSHYGSPAKPTVLQLSSATGISNVETGGVMEQVELFTTTGRLVLRTHCIDGVLTDNHLLHLPNGVYIQRTTHQDGTIETQKITNNRP